VHLHHRLLSSFKASAPSRNGTASVVGQRSNREGDSKHQGTDPELKFPPNEKLQSVLEEGGLTIFETISDLGFFGWTPKGHYRSLAMTSADEVKDCIQLGTIPKMIASTHTIKPKLPIRFETALDPDQHKSHYPHGAFEIASIHVAVKDRNVDKNFVDFCFGGSTLEILAKAKAKPEVQCLATIVPGTNIILVVRRKDYIQDYSSFGFQMEKLATGGRFTDREDVSFVEHLQLMKVAGHSVLFSAEADAVDLNGDPVEIKSSNPHYWGTRTMFQMISSGSLNLFLGERVAGRLVDVRLQSLASVTRDALSAVNIDALESQIKGGMDILKNEARTGKLKEGKVMAIIFVGKTLSLVDYEDHDGVSFQILPPNEVVKSLLD